MYKLCSEKCSLDEEQNRIISQVIKNFKLRGIDLDDKKQNRIKEINKKLSKLSNDFSNNIVDDEAKYEYIISDIEYIKNIPETTLNMAKTLADKKKIK